MLMREKIFIIFILLFPAISFAQGFPDINKAISDERYEQANTILQKEVKNFFAQKNYDTLVAFLPLLGKITAKQKNSGEAVKTVQAFVDRIRTLTTNKKTLRDLHVEAAEFYATQSHNKKAYDSKIIALKIAESMPDSKPAQIAVMHSNLSTYAGRVGSYDLAEAHARKAIGIFLAAPNPDHERIYLSANSMASMMWYASKTDSALYYYDLALKAISKAEPTPVNKYYRTAILQNNLSGLYSSQGNVTKAIQALNITISNLRTFLASPDPHPKKEDAIAFQFEATDNLAGIYKELGDFSKAIELLTYSYQQKQKQLDPSNPDIAKSQILLGQIYYNVHEYDRASSLLKTGFDNISKADGDYNIWKADARRYLALIAEDQGDQPATAKYFNEADSLYETSLQGSYDNIYLEFLDEHSLFQARGKNIEKALQLAEKGYNYMLRTQGAESLGSFQQLLNLSQVYYSSGMYQQSLQRSRKSLEILKKIIGRAESPLDSVRMELQKTGAILLKAKAEYELLPVRNKENLIAILEQLNEALTLLDKRKSIFNDPKDISLMVGSNSLLLDFVKKITMELYFITKDKLYLDKLVGYHESGTYTRIRSRLDKSDSIRFAGVPLKVQEQELVLKSSISRSLSGNGSHNDKMSAYFRAVSEWNTYLQTIRQQYPEYYRMRYGSLLRSLDQIQSSIPGNTSLVRYFFIEDKLFAMVADRKQKEIVSLNVHDLEKQIQSVSRYGMDEARTTETLYNLYRQLWQPLAGMIKNRRLIIIPDGILYGLSFELLTEKQISGFSGLASHSLLAKHLISYHYSMLALESKLRVKNYSENFIAFAPGFSDAEKQKYLSALKDSSSADRSYLSLLPQPFTIGFASKARNLLGGSVYLNESSTAQNFRTKAGRHRIIHIGTHAEANDIRPEYSRLIFSKDQQGSGNDNSVFLHELYNCDLSSELTVLTACESGKAGFQTGEGMISLAHAFNYSGSESILTGLWKIDEQASTVIMEKFYDHLLDGQARDEALRNAKLEYLQTARGRMLAPQYWAGLVLMGDFTAIQIEKNNYFWVWIVVSLLLITLAGMAVIFKVDKE
jgi:CHAT domain-containing protein